MAGRAGKGTLKKCGFLSPILAIPLFLLHDDCGQLRDAQDLLVDDQGLYNEVLSEVLLPACGQFGILSKLVADLLFGGLPAQVLLQAAVHAFQAEQYIHIWNNMVM
jgi:hypothetical protein